MRSRILAHNPSAGGALVSPLIDMAYRSSSEIPGTTFLRPLPRPQGRIASWNCGMIAQDGAKHEGRQSLPANLIMCAEPRRAVVPQFEKLRHYRFSDALWPSLSDFGRN